MDIGRAALPTWNFAILNASQFVILLPQIGFDDFSCRQKAKDGNISFREIAIPVSPFGKDRRSIRQQPYAESACSSNRETFTQKGTTAGNNFRVFSNMLHELFLVRLLRIVIQNLVLVIAMSKASRAG